MVFYVNNEVYLSELIYIMKKNTFVQFERIKLHAYSTVIGRDIRG